MWLYLKYSKYFLFQIHNSLKIAVTLMGTYQYLILFTLFLYA